MARIGHKIKSKVNQLKTDKKEYEGVQARRSQRLAKKSKKGGGLKSRGANARPAGVGGKYKIRGCLTTLETRESINAAGSHKKVPRVSIGSLNNLESAEKKTRTSVEHTTSITKRRPDRLYKKCTKGLKPTNRKPEQQPNPVFSLEQILCASNNKEQTHQSEISTKYSKSEYSRLSRSDISQSFRRTYIDVMNKVEHNLFENLKQGNILPKSSRKSELAKQVVVEHGNKVISFIKEVSQGQTDHAMETEEEVGFGESQANGCELTQAEKDQQINDFKELLGNLEKDIISSVEIIEEMLYRRTLPILMVQQLMDEVSKQVPGFHYEHINLINTVYGDLYDIVYSGSATHIRAMAIGAFDYDDMLKYRQLRIDKLSELLSSYLNNHISDMTAKFERSLNPYHLSIAALFARSIKFLKVARVHKEEKKQEESAECVEDPQISAFYIPEAETPEKQPVNPKKVVLDTKSQIADYVS